MLLCARGLYPANRTKPRAAKPHLYFVRSLFLASGKARYALAAARAIIVLPAFVRSLSADGEEITNSIIKKTPSGNRKGAFSFSLVNS